MRDFRPAVLTRMQSLNLSRLPSPQVSGSKKSPAARLSKRLPALALGLLLSLGVCAPPALAARPGHSARERNPALEKAVKTYLLKFKEGWEAMADDNFDKAIATQEPVEKLYREVIKVAFEHCKCDAEEARRIILNSQNFYMRLTVTLGQRLYDVGRFQDAIRVFDRGQAINDEYPCLRYEKGFTYVAMKQADQAATELYEAKRLARFPSRSTIPSSLGAEEDVICPRVEVDSHSDGLLQQMGKPTDYPLGVDLATGATRVGRIVPGMGLQWLWKGNWNNLYLDESTSSVLKKLGEPDKREKWQMMGEYLPYLTYGDLRIALDADGQHVRFMHLATPGRPILTPKGYLETGAPAASVHKLLGKDFGYRHAAERNSDKPMKEFLDYTQLGLVFHIDREGKIAMISLYPPS